MTSETTESRLRIEWADAAVFALNHCRPHHANAICAAWLQAAETGGPRHDPFGMLYSDARFWAAAAPPHELVAYTLAGLEQVPRAHLTLPDRMEVFKVLWCSLPDTERVSFIQHVTGDCA